MFLSIVFGIRIFSYWAHICAGARIEPAILYLPEHIYDDDVREHQYYYK